MFQINTERLVSRIKSLGAIGFEKGKGTTRVAYSPAFFEGRDYVETLMRQAGLQTKIDPVGNLIGFLPGKRAERIAIGSHIDTVPGGGMYDGTYGVLSGLEVLQTLVESGYENDYTLEIIAFNEEEGNAVGGTFGSKAFAGVSQETSAIEKCSEYGITEEDIEASREDPAHYKAYLEWHIEQGGLLENEDLQLGIVDGIVAITRFMVTVNGKANHAGSTPMKLRDDALEKAAKVISAAYDVSRETDKSMTCTIGYVQVQPGAVNVIPGQVSFPIELRSMDTGNIRTAVEKLKALFDDGSVSITGFLWQDETRLNPELTNCIEACCRKNGFSYRRMPSGAGHDAINMAPFTPSAMLFIPSINGISHSIEEYSRDIDLENGCRVLMDVVLTLDGRKENED